jgi:hypothetical protein
MDRIPLIVTPRKDPNEPLRLKPSLIVHHQDHTPMIINFSKIYPLFIAFECSENWEAMITMQILGLLATAFTAFSEILTLPFYFSRHVFTLHYIRVCENVDISEKVEYGSMRSNTLQCEE